MRIPWYTVVVAETVAAKLSARLNEYEQDWAFLNYFGCFLLENFGLGSIHRFWKIFEICQKPLEGPDGKYGCPKNDFLYHHLVNLKQKIPFNLQDFEHFFV